MSLPSRSIPPFAPDSTKSNSPPNELATRLSDAHSTFGSHMINPYLTNTSNNSRSSTRFSRPAWDAPSYYAQAEPSSSSSSALAMFNNITAPASTGMKGKSLSGSERLVEMPRSNEMGRRLSDERTYIDSNRRISSGSEGHRNSLDNPNIESSSSNQPFYPPQRAGSFSLMTSSRSPILRKAEPISSTSFGPIYPSYDNSHSTSIPPIQTLSPHRHSIPEDRYWTNSSPPDMAGQHRPANLASSSSFDRSAAAIRQPVPIMSSVKRSVDDMLGKTSGSNRRDDGNADSQKMSSGRAGNKRRRKFTRTKTGCLCCRKRRIKCDEGRPTCKRCIIAKRECEYAEEAREGSRSDEEEDDEEDVKTEPPEPQRIIHPPPPPLPADQDPFSIISRGDEFDTSQEFITMPEPEVFMEEIKFLPDESVLGLENMYATHTAPTDQSIPLLPETDFNWDSTFVGGYEDSNVGQYFQGVEDRFNENYQGNEQDQQVALNRSAPILSTPNFLLPWFPTAEERSLILHYCANAADLMMAIPSGLNPMLAINLPLALHSPRGMNPASDALRVALLGIGAIHQAFLLARSGTNTAQTASMFQYAANLRDTGKEMVRRATLNKDGLTSDATLGAATSLALIDMLFGGHNWQGNFNLARDMIVARGGPVEMLKASQPTPLADGVTVSAARLNLEILAIYEAMGCLTTGEEPMLLSEKWGNWWFEKFEKTKSTWEENSVEKQFGMSRTMVHLFSRLTRLLSRVERYKNLIPEPTTRMNHEITSSSRGGRNGHLVSGFIAEIGIDEGIDIETETYGDSDWSNNGLGLLSMPQGTDPIILEANKLNEDVDAWIESLQIATLEHERVQVGNKAYAYAMKVLLLRNVFRVPRTDARVQNAANEVLTHCSTSTALLGMSIDLTWPAIIAASCVTTATSREWVLTLFEGFKSQCCFDIETAARIVREVWNRVDRGLPRDDWKEVCQDLKLQVLLC